MGWSVEQFRQATIFETFAVLTFMAEQDVKGRKERDYKRYLKENFNPEFDIKYMAS